MNTYTQILKAQIDTDQKEFDNGISRNNQILIQTNQSIQNQESSEVIIDEIEEFRQQDFNQNGIQLLKEQSSKYQQVTKKIEKYNKKGRRNSNKSVNIQSSQKTIPANGNQNNTDLKEQQQIKQPNYKQNKNNKNSKQINKNQCQTNYPQNTKRFLRSHSKQLLKLKTQISETPRTKKIHDQVLQMKLNLLTSYQLLQKKIAQKKLWRPEILSEILDFAFQNTTTHLKKALHAQEEKLRSSLFLMNKQKQNQLLTWNYLLVDKSKKVQFQTDLLSQNIKSLENYGKILKKGVGRNPPKEVIQNIKKEFMMFEYEPGFFIKKQGMEFYDKENYTQAIEQFNVYLEQYNHTNKTAIINRGLSYMKLKKFDKALEDLQNCHKLYPQCHTGFMYSGWVKYQQSNLESALYDLLIAQELNNQDIYVYIYLSLTFMKLKVFDKSEEACLNALKLNPNNVFAQAVLHKIKTQKVFAKNQQKQLNNNIKIMNNIQEQNQILQNYRIKLQQEIDQQLEQQIIPQIEE
ncbi:hypothetical protein PPERSA_07070 [Pseudocohnilembus persalinus]|uniref:Uncharacterized protein n=1 Tax=Pseudocohnilembus persalinus TaxID=266149 RepID=A0A0V0QAS6_PSEPJ|nr:hypothetical protein PPERSA_07070 [Pseudocohnilembus persalinus]|eukprot:KRW99298.1 hypothetical protein PPERSA_07070 [Pseudocohnilembus persalinus]